MLKKTCKRLKTVDWKNDRGVDVVRWEIISIPSPSSKIAAERLIFKNSLESEGWEVIAETVDVSGNAAFFVEMDNVEFVEKLSKGKIRRGGW